MTNRHFSPPANESKTGGVKSLTQAQRSEVSGVFTMDYTEAFKGDNQPTETVELQKYSSGTSKPGYNKPVALTLESIKLQRRMLQTQDRPAAVVKHENHWVPSGLCHAVSR